MGSMVFINPLALSSALAVLGMLQPRTLRFINGLYPSVSESNLYIENMWFYWDTWDYIGAQRKPVFLAATEQLNKSICQLVSLLKFEI